MACIHFKDDKGRGVHLLYSPEFKPGDQPPKGYCDWHEWAEVQIKAGLRQKRCPVCGLLRFPQESCCESEPKKKARRK